MTGNKELVPLAHYTQKYRDADASDITRRTGAAFDGDKSAFALSMLGFDIAVPYPEFDILAPEGAPPSLTSHASRILVIRYLLEGSCAEARGGFLSYREIPWGTVYERNFQGRCVLRLARAYGSKLSAFGEAAEKLGGVKRTAGDTSCDIPFLGGVTLRLILWEGDEEFSPTAQILFSDNTPLAFTAEDLAAVGEVVIAALKEVAR
jgi:hypothetical protein